MPTVDEFKKELEAIGYSSVVCDNPNDISDELQFTAVNYMNERVTLKIDKSDTAIHTLWESPTSEHPDHVKGRWIFLSQQEVVA